MLQWGRRRSSTKTSRCGHVTVQGLAVLQWGRRRSSTKTRVPPRTWQPRGLRFNGVVDARRRRLPMARRELWSTPRFNGVVDARRRRRCTGFTRSSVERASMGSSTLVDEDSVLVKERTREIHMASMGSSTLVDEDRGGVVRGSPGRGDRFNGVVDARRRRLVGRITAYADLALLQWGRRRSSTKTRLARGARPEQAAASMGSSTLVDEDASRTLSPGDHPLRFNGVVDARRRRLLHELDLADAEDELQWGRRRSSTKTLEQFKG